MRYPNVLPFAALLWALAASACGTSAPVAPDAAPQAATPRGALRIVHTTDLHGHYSDPAAAAPGGMRALAAMVDAFEADGAAVMLLDSGDMWSGTLLSDRWEGATGVALFNAMGYAAAALGNHEFDYGPVGQTRVATHAGQDAFGALKARLLEARFPVLTSNVHAQATGKMPLWPQFRPSLLLAAGGVKVGLVGGSTTETGSVTFPYVGAMLRFLPLGSAIEAQARQLRARGADLIVVLAHEGAECDDDDPTRCDADSPAFVALGQMSPGTVDLWLGGHTHQRVNAALEVKGHTINIAQAKVYGREVVVVDVLLPQVGPPQLAVALVPVVAPAGTMSKRRDAVDALLAPVEAEVAAIRAEPLGPLLSAPLTRDHDGGSALGAWVCDQMLALPAHADREICLVNAGGLRKNLPAGAMTYGDLYAALPFGNAPAYMDVTGAELRALVRTGTAGVHGTIQVGGLRVRFDRTADHCPTEDRNGDGTIDGLDRDRLLSLTLPNGTPLDDARLYHVLTSSFLALGGDGWLPLIQRISPQRITIRHDLLPSREAIAQALRGRLASGGTSWAVGEQETGRVIGVGTAPTDVCDQ